MKELGQSIATIMWFVFCLALVFILQGEPNLWTIWQEAARGVCK